MSFFNKLSGLKKVKRILPVSSRSFHGYEGEFRETLQQVSGQLSARDAQINDLRREIGDMRSRLDQLQEKHEYEEDRQMMLFWAAYQKPGEALEETKLRFFRSLPEASGNDRLFQKAELKLFTEFINVCAEHGITYWSIAGTLLGAYRHHGMIPWDDDIDVLIPRDDLQRLRAAVRDDPRYRITELWDWNVVCRQIRFRLADADNPVFVDLFPMDWSGGDYRSDYEANQLIRRQFVRECREKFAGTGWERSPYMPVGQPLADEVDAMYDQAYKASAGISHILPDRSGATGIIYGIENLDERRPSGPYPIGDWLPVQGMGFEGLTIAVNPGWRNYLSAMYGDYLSIPQDIHSHNHVDKREIYSDKTVRVLTRYISESEG